MAKQNAINSTINSATSGVTVNDNTGALSTSATTTNQVQIGNASGQLTGLTVGTNGQVLVGSSAAAPVFATLTTDSSPATIAYTTGAGSLQIKVNSAVKVTTFTGSGTWTADARTTWVKVYFWNSGSGGGSGRRGATTAAGGGGGGQPGTFIVMEGPISTFGSPVTVTIGGTSAGGTAISVDNTNGNPGSLSNRTTFGSIISGNPSVQAAGGTTTTAAGATSINGWYYDSNSQQSTNPNGGAGSNTTGTTPSAITANMWPTGGGGGSGANSTTPQQAGSGSLIRALDSTTLVAGGVGGLEGTTATTGGNAGNSGVNIRTGGTGGGGGGGMTTTAAQVTGGNGGIPGGGGGGGGGSINGTNSGKGGDGARGECWVIEFF